MRVARLAALMAVASLPFAASSASAASCVAGSVATYTAPGFTCDVNGVVFSNISVTPTITGNATVTLTGFQPFSFGGEFGLSLIYLATASGPGDRADIAWTYQVSGNLLTDALLALSGNVTGTGQIGVSETLVPNGVNLSLNGPGTTTATFAPIASLFVLKDDFALVPAGICSPITQQTSGCGTATSSILTNAFSLTQVPIPGALGLFATGLGMMGVLGWRKKRNTKTFA